MQKLIYYQAITVQHNFKSSWLNTIQSAIHKTCFNTILIRKKKIDAKIKRDKETNQNFSLFTGSQSTKLTLL